MDWNPEGLYFDPSANRHYGKLINDHWKPDENSCEIRWNEETKRVEVWSLVPIPLYKELGTNYNDPYWYRTNNELTTLVQATQVRVYYGRKDLPWYAEMKCTTVTTGVLTPANRVTGSLEDTIKAQVEPQERSKRDRKYRQPSQGSPRPVTHKRKQVLKGRTAKSGAKQQHRWA